MCAPTSTQRLAQRSCQSARPSSGLLPWLWLAKSITRGGAAERRGHGAGAEGVDRARGAELPVQVRVHVDRAGHDQEPAGVVHLQAIARRQIAPDGRDLAAIDQDVALVLALRGDDPPALDQRRHVRLPRCAVPETTAADAPR